MRTCCAAGDSVINEWPLDGVDAPHDLTISSAPLRITGSGERMLAVYVAETLSAGSQLHKHIILHRGTILSMLRLWGRRGVCTC